MNALLCLFVLSAAPSDAPTAEGFARNRYNRIIETGADVLAPGEHQVGLFFGEYAVGLAPRLQVSSHLAGVLVSYVNVKAKYQFLKLHDLQLSLAAGGGWLALTQLFGIAFITAPVELRATVPLGRSWEMSLGPTAQWLYLNAQSATQQSLSFSTELNWVRYDALGAWYFKSVLPLVSYQRASFKGTLDKTIVGDLLLDNVEAFSFLAGRDLLLGKYVHLRGGIGYRNRPGLILIESLGNLLLEFNFLIRWGG